MEVENGVFSSRFLEVVGTNVFFDGIFEIE